MYFFGKNFRTTREICNRRKEVEGHQERKLKQKMRDGIVVCNTYNFLSSPILFQYLKYFNLPKCITGFLWA